MKLMGENWEGIGKRVFGFSGDIYSYFSIPT